jgi:ABC-2 type transport system permease protein
MDSAAAVPVDRPLLALLIRVKMRSLWNRVVKAAAEAPIRVSLGAFLVALIWLGLFELFWIVFRQIDQSTPLEATVAIPLIYNLFFATMMIMLAFSNAIIVHGMLFSRQEAEYLLSAPIRPRDLVAVKFFESLLLASWSLILLGLPLMMAMAQRTEDDWFCVLFLAFFVCFIPIPASLGLLFAWLTARFFPRNALRAAAFALGGVLVVAVIWCMRAIRMREMATDVWLRSFLQRVSFVESAFLPNNWIARGIDHALNHRLTEALMYLAVTAANALFLSWVVVWLVSHHFGAAYDRASTGGGGGRRDPVDASGGICGRVFFYLPLPLRLIAAKDLRTFFRDPVQYSQLLILFSLIILYLTNMPTLQRELGHSMYALVIPLLNLCATCLILATFTCRFVFPLVSLEGRQLWFIGLLPLSRGRILRAKFAFAMTVTLLVTCAAIAYGAMMLNMPLVWTGIHLVTTVAICFGLCGLAVGVGARMPMFDQPNAARIANGLGGTVNLIASLTLTTCVITAVGIATWHSRNIHPEQVPAVGDLILCGSAAGISVCCGLLALQMGEAHFNKVEV